MFAYRGSTAMITGSSKALGAAFAKELACRCMILVLAARSIDTLQDLADSLGAQNGVRCVALQADLAASDAVKRIATRNASGRIEQGAPMKNQASAAKQAVV